MITAQKNIFHFEFSNGEQGMFQALNDAESLCHNSGLDDKQAYLVQLCIEELVTNALRYGKPGHSIHFDITLELRDPDVVLTIQDDANPFNPLTQAPQPDLESDIEDRAIGGLGIHMLRSMTKTMQYDYTDHHNRMTLTF